MLKLKRRGGLKRMVDKNKMAKATKGVRGEAKKVMTQIKNLKVFLYLHYLKSKFLSSSYIKLGLEGDSFFISFKKENFNKAIFLLNKGVQIFRELNKEKKAGKKTKTSLQKLKTLKKLNRLQKELNETLKKPPKV